MAMFSTFLIFVLTVEHRWNVWLSMLAVVGLSLLAGAAIHRGLIRPLEQAQRARPGHLDAGPVLRPQRARRQDLGNATPQPHPAAVPRSAERQDRHPGRAAQVLHHLQGHRGLGDGGRPRHPRQPAAEEDQARTQPTEPWPQQSRCCEHGQRMLCSASAQSANRRPDVQTSGRSSTHSSPSRTHGCTSARSLPADGSLNAGSRACHPHQRPHEALGLLGRAARGDGEAIRPSRSAAARRPAERRSAAPRRCRPAGSSSAAPDRRATPAS